MRLNASANAVSSRPAEEQFAIASVTATAETASPSPAAASEVAAAKVTSTAPIAADTAPRAAVQTDEETEAVQAAGVTDGALDAPLQVNSVALDSPGSPSESLAETDSSTSQAIPDSGNQPTVLAVSPSAPAVSIQVDMAVMTSETSGNLTPDNALSTGPSSEAVSPDSGASVTATQSNSVRIGATGAISDASQSIVGENATAKLVEQSSGITSASDSSQDDIQAGANSQILASLPQKDDLTTAQPLSSLEFEQSGSLEQDTADLFQLSFEETGVFTANLHSLSADADIQLIQDKNANGQVDAGEIVAWEREHHDGDESIRHFVQEGDYVLRILDQDISPEPTNYNVSTSFQAAETDDLAFSIDVVFQSSAGQLNDQAKQAIERAADYWENVISYSSFDRPVELALGIYGTTDTANPYLAYAGPLSYQTTENDKLLPVAGATVLNDIYLDQYNSNPNYLESIVRHEIGHVLGLGVTWDQQGNDLVDQDKAVYRAETYAGLSYGELLGTGVATEIPVDQASLTHWDEATFDVELMTPTAEGIGNPLPLSQMTISSLRDLGWNVNYGAADAFALPPSASMV